jgi:hypothetical protein
VWLFAMSSLFILVVVAFPIGLAGLYRSYGDPWIDRLLPAARPRDRSPTIASVEGAHASAAASE